MLTNKLLGLISGNILAAGEFAAWVVSFRDTLMLILNWVLILLTAGGAVYAIILGINLAKSDSADKREEAKGRIINVFKGLLILIVLLVVFLLITNNIEGIMAYFQNPNGIGK